MAATEVGKVFTGCRARFLINGVPIGWAQGVSGTERIVYEPVTVLDNIRVQEHVPIGYEVELSASRVRIVGKTLKSEGFFPATAGNSTDQLKNILNKGDLVMSIEDTQEGIILAQYTEVKVSSHSFSIGPRGIVVTDVQFVVTAAFDESEV